jgi:AraC family ethanolamine operon transcriptional activator
VTIDLSRLGEGAKNAESALDRTEQGNARVHLLVAYDADEQARNLYGWRQTYDQLTAGRFVGTLEELRLDQMQLFCETTSQTLRQSCEVQSDAYWFGIPLCGDAGGRIDANIIGSGAVALRPGGTEFELLTPAGYEILGIVVSGEVLRRFAERVEQSGFADRLPCADVLWIGDENRMRLGALLRQMLANGAAAGQPISPFARSNLQSSVLSLLFDVGAVPCEERVVIPGRPRRQWIVSEARQYLLANRDRPVSVPELCELFHVSRRTLQYCFQDVLGMAPGAYLRAIRLNGVRRELQKARCELCNVQDVAAAWGFWHMSQFATDYRKLFGLRPSDTLKGAMGERYGERAPSPDISGIQRPNAYHRKQV